MTSDTRQQLYDRIRESSLDEVTLEEMIRHGFWKADDPVNDLPAEMVKRRGELQKEITDLASKARGWRNPDRALREIMKQRMAEARARRIETKERQAKARHDRALAWHQRRSDDIVHLGDTVSAALSERGANPERLKAHGVPAFDDVAGIAEAMGIEIAELRFLAYDRAASTVTHYQRFRIPKKTGGYRTLSAPMPRLKRAQYWLLDTVLEKVEPHEAAHGFRIGRSILTNAAPHQKQAVVINLDLKDFFPSISYRRVKGLFRSFGYAEAQAAVFALLATEADRTEMTLDGRSWHVANGERVLPQGAPTSPAITNLLCRRLDRRMNGVAGKYGFVYTRYADDLTFSAAEDDGTSLRKLLWSVRNIIEDEGFTLNEDKTRIMRRGSRQEVTGITVNDGLSVSRKERRKFKAHLHHTELGIADGPFRRGSPKSSALGYAQFLEMVHGDGVAALTAQARKIHGAPAPRPETASSLREAAAKGTAPSANWWTPKKKAMPELEQVAKPSGYQPKPAASQVPRTRTTGRTGAQTPPTATPSARPTRGAAMAWPWKVLLSILAVVAVIPIPLGGFIAGLVIYLLWFRRR